ncbi:MULTISPECIES: hypothetical protein [unclassified Sphingopyxis]|uniref:hypothetical protein n=1 Tax=unclassified Sphingopyxis TaxID=2614943 RepID=UPI00073035FD|nr:MULTISPECIES: hypothetical protein [unclassified Sphingopyxis]KTE23135.1 hypothetical protein ATE61_17765 [Sphingopyxis sp. H057]KTE48474.1 hypothetical protein ATE64_20605 [Sphingopyxis sp. H073]KTE50073.1 hypothetical protein ATE69_18560 [Sphingopyxis sp. H071]KTE58520.1 hypothetical protein ATE66_15180 [Sphingopyxis sp. H107]KTE63219.1 hypothetical protein ATE65_16305 [Sphingopyxis sp. H100]
MFLDCNGVEICTGHVVRAPITGNRELHGAWADYTVEKAPGGYKLSYLRSEKGDILPVGYTGGYMADTLPDDDEFDIKALVFTKMPLRVSGWEIVG